MPDSRPVEQKMTPARPAIANGMNPLEQAINDLVEAAKHHQRVFDANESAANCVRAGDMVEVLRREVVALASVPREPEPVLPADLIFAAQRALEWAAKFPVGHEYSGEDEDIASTVYGLLHPLVDPAVGKYATGDWLAPPPPPPVRSITLVARLGELAERLEDAPDDAENTVENVAAWRGRRRSGHGECECPPATRPGSSMNEHGRTLRFLLTVPHPCLMRP